MPTKSPKNEKLKCFACGKSTEFKTSNPAYIGMVNDALIFRASGNYGSTIFDPIQSEEYLEIIICDECITKNCKKVKHIHIRTEKTAKVRNFDTKR